MEMSEERGNMRVALDTLGCKLNQAETELLARQFGEAGYRMVSPDDEADIYILNTCTVTHITDRKARHRLKRARRRNPSALVVAAGCYVERARPELTQIEGVDLLVNNEEKPHLLRLLEESGLISSPVCVQIDTIGCLYGGLRTRALVKVQDGCNSFCAYCVVPLVRGREKSLPVDRVIGEVGQRVAEGCKEVVLTGTEIGAYNHNGVGLKELLEHILSDTDVTRLRMSSVQPQEISPALMGLWRDSRLCRHFHLSLQSGSDAVLERMNRRYSTGDYQCTVSSIRDVVSESAITTDIIVGFPGETAEEFEQSYGYCRRMEFARIHVFQYSPRSGTRAALMRQQVTAQVKKQRSQQMLALAEESARNFRQRFSGRVMEVLWEQQSEAGVWSGLTGNYIKVYTRSSEDLTNKLLSVKLGEIRGDGMWGEIK